MSRNIVAKVKCPWCHCMTRRRKDGTYGKHKISWSRSRVVCGYSGKKIKEVN